PVPQAIKPLATWIFQKSNQQTLSSNNSQIVHINVPQPHPSPGNWRFTIFVCFSPPPHIFFFGVARMPSLPPVKFHQPAHQSVRIGNVQLPAVWRECDTGNLAKEVYPLPTFPCDSIY